MTSSETKQQLQKLNDLFNACYITLDEYHRRKRELLGINDNDNNTNNNTNTDIPTTPPSTPPPTCYNPYAATATSTPTSNDDAGDIPYYNPVPVPKDANIYSMQITFNSNVDLYNNDIPILNESFSNININNNNNNNNNNNSNNNYLNHNYTFEHDSDCVSDNDSDSDSDNDHSDMEYDAPAPAPTKRTNSNNNNNSKSKSNNNNTPKFKGDTGGPAFSDFFSSTPAGTPKVATPPTKAKATPAPAPASSSTQTFGSMLFTSSPNTAPAPPPRKDTQIVSHNGRDYLFTAQYPGSVLRVVLHNWTKELNNYGRPDEPTPDTITKWKTEQANLHTRLVEGNVKFLSMNSYKYIGGVDISFAKNNKIDACASLVVIEYPSLKVVYESYKMVKLTQPYIAGYLAFREAPHLMPLWEDLKRLHPQFIPDVVIVDGNGINHMRGMGAACHLGILMDRPTIGVAKQLLVCHGITHESLQTKTNNPIPMVAPYSGKLMGFAIKNSDGEQIYISPGHQMDSHRALELVQATMNKRPIPEPTFIADQVSRQFLKDYYSKFRV
ncbi:hypothetical protein SAMD00019534_047300, partial [Acytostelium subglobosum LB1]|uniref:hypothetical protein n=1 Tax=Acytostelium subglobosum LB1 TaxID=1410327 RepID=UPI000644E225